MSGTGPRRRGGFTLVEMMVVVAVIATIIAIAIPSFLTSRMQANESTAVANVTTMRNACQTYYSQKSPHAYPGDLTELALPKISPPYLDQGLAGVGSTNPGGASEREGYLFTYAKQTDDAFELEARPKAYGLTGRKSFYSNQTSIITATTDDRSATANDPQIQ
ncbi:MAG: prepilin-type N-terminal cleavage/methylation domain-containing protein [Candidatus Omnitrophica bacterium]|nr:prepilin-type N-terminal cleavage/methylation domain-containing protein [Candidatus Omnitrophota bacterium]